MIFFVDIRPGVFAALLQLVWGRGLLEMKCRYV